MNNLWKKEATRTEYVDLFASVKEPLFDILLRTVKLQQNKKNNQRSTECRLEGNAFFDQRNWIEANKCYNQSLCFAEVGTENVAMAYSNRSACFFKLAAYNEVLIDIELAKKANLPDRLIQKLDQRRNESLKLLSTAKRIITFEPKLSYKADKNFPCMANVVEIKYNEEFGRHLVAKCDIPVGKTILVEKNSLRVVDDPFACYTCSLFCRNCIACPNCADVMFCSSDCMNSDQNHKWECDSIFAKSPLHFRFAIVTLLLAINSFPSVDNLIEFVEEALLESPEKFPTSLTESSKSKYHFFFKLTKSAPYASVLIEAYKVYKFAMNLPRVSSLFDSERKKRFLMHLVMHHNQIINSNSGVGENVKIIGGVGSILNHSCAPNIVDCAQPGHKFYLTARPIKKGEQLFWRYLELEDLSSSERKAKLSSRWGFDCKCEKCEPKCAPLDRKLTTSDPCYKYLVKNQNDKHKSYIIQKKCIEFLKKYGRSTWSPEMEFVFNIFRRELSRI